MEAIVALGIGVLAGCGVWLVLRPRTFQVVIGLSLLSYSVNLLIFIMGWVRGGRAPIVGTSAPVDVASFTDPTAAIALPKKSEIAGVGLVKVVNKTPLVPNKYATPASVAPVSS